MLDMIEKVSLGEAADERLSLYKVSGAHYLLRHLPFAFIRLTDEYASTLKALFSDCEDRSSLDADIVAKLQVFLKDEGTVPAAPTQLRRLNLLVAQMCNSRCRYCYAGDGDYGDEMFMPAEVAKEAIAGAMKHFDSIENIQFFGGEPLLAAKLIIELVSFTENLAVELKKRVPIFLLTTNLTILPDDILELIKAGKISVLTSLDGPADAHDYNRRFSGGKPTYDTVVRNIKKLAPYSQPRSIEATYTAHHRDIGLTPQQVKAHVHSISPTARVNVIPTLDSSDGTAWKIFHADLLSYCAGESGWDAARLRPVLTRYREVVSGKTRRDIFCDMGVRNFTVDARGRVWPCQVLCNKSESLGSIADGWESIAQRFTAGLGKSLRKSNFKDCRSCFLKDYCTSCPVSWPKAEGGMSPSGPHCEADRRAYFTAFRHSLETQAA